MASYRQKIEGTTARANAAAKAGRDIAADYPRKRGNKRRREACAGDLKLFLETYFAGVFYHGWSCDHPRIIGRIQTATLGGGLFALAMPRASGKTAILVRAALWALLYGHRRYVVPIGATEDDAARLLRTVKAELLDNPLLGEDFPHVCYPIRRLENNARRCVGQLFKGKRTAIEWKMDQITLPVMPDAACRGPNVSAAKVEVAGLTGSVRGKFHTLPSGETIRPDLVLLDDVQTRESANSVKETSDRLGIVRGDILGLAGPGNPITCFAALTVINDGDLADQLLDRERNPQWRGERTAAVYAWPTAEDRWAEYHRIRAEAMRRDESTEAATTYYRQHRAEMDAGAVIAWPERHNPDEVSAVQHVENLRFDLGEEAFAAEHQNEPLRGAVEVAQLLTAKQVSEQLNGLPRGIVPLQASFLTAFVDCHDALLFWAVTAWATDFRGWCVDYGTWPPQRKRSFTLRNAEPNLASMFPGASPEAAIWAGLKALSAELLDKEWQKEGGAAVRMDRALIDSGYVPDVVFDFCRRSPHASILLPSRGAGITAAKTPMTEYTPKPGERHGWYWLIGTTPHRASKYGRFDTNFWKGFVHSRLALAVGDKGNLSLFGNDPEGHRLFSQQVVAESPHLRTENGRTVAEWRPKPGAGANHWLDCLVGTAVAASMAGAAVEGREPTPAKKVDSGKGSWRERYEKARAKA